MLRSSRNTTAKGRPDNRLQDKATPKAPKRARAEAEESDEGSHGRNRHRVTRACNECRRRKDRCDGHRPCCMSCVENGRSCSYGPSKKRGLRTGYVRAIEVLLGLIFTTIEGSESWICGLLEGNVRQVSFRTVSEGQDSDISAEFLLEAWRKGSVAKEVGKLLAPDGVEEDDEGADSTRYFDTKVAEALALSLTSRSVNTGAPPTPMNTDTTPQDAGLFDLSATPIATNPPISVVGEEETSPHVSNDQPPQPALSIDQGDSSSSVPKLPSHWPYLLDLYFETTHSWLPISQKHDLLRAAYTLGNGNAAMTATTSGESAFLHVVLAYASHQSESLLNSSKPPFDTAYNTQSWRTLTQTTLFTDPATYDLGHIRALLVLSLFEMDRKFWPAAWVFIGRAIYTAISIGLLPRNPETANVSCDDGVRRTLLGCAALETIIAARLNTTPYLQSSDIILKGQLTIDGVEEWEPWQPKILISKQSTPSHQTSNPYIPGHVISTFNRLLKVIAPLNDLIHQRKHFAPEKSFDEILRGCQHNLSTLNDLTTATSMPPQTLCLWLASAATFENVAAEYLTSMGTSLERPDGYWARFTWLASLPEKRVQLIGRVSISPIVEACLILLQESLGRQEVQYVGTAVENDLNLLRQSISRSLMALQDPSEKDIRLPGLISDPHLQSADEQVGQTQHTIQLGSKNDSIPPMAVVPSKIPPSTSILDTRLDGNHGMESSLPQASTNTITQPSSNIPLEPITASLEDLDDDGLFDSLATLDSTDWLANPPEFMQHLGLLENAPNDMETILDMEF
ncbi:hypothetical protein NW762_010310 [Fusarium torreyae]|uniref:Zn(2)-C6 fungal-type domain-containing protein n=1 Tax=Fusarium torreyae TaxID=1237075 RepID=A0A9W8RUN7_9HYPO|nr:hypothetical protein NW762_010310 [Fusarium torreyae]